MDDLISRLQDATSKLQCLTGVDIEPRYLGDNMHTLHEGWPLAVVRPESVAQVSAVLRLCNEAGVAVVPQGAMTGLGGAATASLAIASIHVWLGG